MVEIRSPHGLFPRFESRRVESRRRLLSVEDHTIPRGLTYTSRRSSSEVWKLNRRRLRGGRNGCNFYELRQPLDPLKFKCPPPSRNYSKYFYSTRLLFRLTFPLRLLFFLVSVIFNGYIDSIFFSERRVYCFIINCSSDPWILVTIILYTFPLRLADIDPFTLLWISIYIYFPLLDFQFSIFPFLSPPLDDNHAHHHSRVSVALDPVSLSRFPFVNK